MVSKEKPLPTQPRASNSSLNQQRLIPADKNSIPGIATVIVGRLSDAPLQYVMFTQGWAVKGLTAVGIRASNLLIAAGPGVAGLGPIPTLLTGMYAVAGLRHGYWMLVTNTYSWTPGTALPVVAYNAAVNTANTLVAVNALTSAPFPITGDFVDCIGWKQWAGIALFAAGILMEIIAEESRKQFKKDPKNKGKIDDTGLWSVVRHPNFLGYTLWRAGITLTTGSLVWTGALTALQILGLVSTGIPGLAAHMSTRYGQQWTDYKRRVPSALIPGVW
ncbi:hypothetical protein B0H15DRAFT_857624 [Mycena belliarum]|uniref:Steroid 5-alpha reductase C-terminal domain-containing protein n=1 Tax=Mycena belliarum TaxID=1033014 RepID=A0AAD6TUF8_9AGAR|nr:hypothetical protein B0H15DRAFT_857624 [Mycena belliae]